MHIFRYLEITVAVEKRFLRKLAFSVFVVAAVVPVGIAAVSVCADVIGDIRNYKLRFGDVVLFEVLKIIVVNLAFQYSVHLPEVITTVKSRKPAVCIGQLPCHIRALFFKAPTCEHVQRNGIQVVPYGEIGAITVKLAGL